LFAVGLHACTAVARSLCISWAYLFYVHDAATTRGQYLLHYITLWIFNVA